MSLLAMKIIGPVESAGRARRKRRGVVQVVLSKQSGSKSRSGTGTASDERHARERERGASIQGRGEKSVRMVSGGGKSEQKEGGEARSWVMAARWESGNKFRGGEGDKSASLARSENAIAVQRVTKRGKSKGQRKGSRKGIDLSLVGTFLRFFLRPAFYASCNDRSMHLTSSYDSIARAVSKVIGKDIKLSPTRKLRLLWYASKAGLRRGKVSSAFRWLGAVQNWKFQKPRVYIKYRKCGTVYSFTAIPPRFVFLSRRQIVKEFRTHWSRRKKCDVDKRVGRTPLNGPLEPC